MAGKLIQRKRARIVGGGISGKPPVLVFLDRETVDSIDSLGETRTGKAQELIKIGLAHELKRMDIEEKISGLGERLDRLEAALAEIKSENIENKEILQKFIDAYKKLGGEINQTRETLLQKIDEEGSKKKGFLR